MATSNRQVAHILEGLERCQLVYCCDWLPWTPRACSGIDYHTAPVVWVLLYCLGKLADVHLWAVASAEQGWTKFGATQVWFGLDLLRVMGK